jgi:hypothetical protein
VPRSARNTRINANALPVRQLQAFIDTGSDQEMGNAARNFKIKLCRFEVRLGRGLSLYRYAYSAFRKIMSLTISAPRKKANMFEFAISSFISAPIA